MANVATGRIKLTVALPLDLIQQVKKWVKETQWSSQSRFVERALVEFLGRLRKEKLRQEFKQASRDPLFLKDLQETERAFCDADTQISLRDD